MEGDLLEEPGKIGQGSPALEPRKYTAEDFCGSGSGGPAMLSHAELSLAVVVGWGACLTLADCLLSPFSETWQGCGLFFPVFLP